MQTLLSKIDEFCHRHGMGRARFGLLALNDKAFVGQIENGRRVWPETEAKVVKFMDEYVPPAAGASEASQAAAA